MSNSTAGMASTTSDLGQVAQTPDNTTMPFDPLPSEPPKKKSTGFTKEMREKKIAEGWIPPEKRNKPAPPQPVTASVLSGMKTMEIKTTQADIVLENLVDKLIQLENNPQFRSVWLHFFNHGGVYNGPRYADELQAACDYLNRRREATAKQS